MTSAGGPTTPPEALPPADPRWNPDPAQSQQWNPDPAQSQQWNPDPVDSQQWYPVAAEPDRITRFFDRIAARSPRWLAPVAILACFGGAVGYTLYADPTRSAPDAAPTCLLKLTTGLDCPGCGGTRAFWYLLHGDLPAAARHHILFVFAVPFLVYLYVAWAGKQLFGWRLPQLSVGPVTIGVFLTAWLTFSVLRNLPWPPFTWLYV